MLNSNNCIPKNVHENVENKECLAFFLCLGTHLMRIYMCKSGWISILLSKIIYIYRKSKECFRTLSDFNFVK